MADHAILSASGSKKWLTCTASARLEETIPDEDSEYSKEGTKAHDLMEIALRLQFFDEKPKPYPITVLVKTEGNKETWSSEMVDLETVEGRREAGFTAEMEDAVKGLYTRVAAVVDDLKAMGVPYTILIEHKVDYSEWAREGFGTADVIVVTTQKIWVFDLKYGQGVPVDATDNSQMKLYGLGAWADLAIAYDDIEEVSLNIHQPRIGNFSSWDISLVDLLAWGEEVKPRAALAWEGKGEYVPGDHCASGFCKARFTCRARAQACLEASAGLTHPDLLTPEEIAAVLPKLDHVEKWAKSVKEFALKSAVEGKAKYPNWKLVEGKSYRYVSDKAEAQKRLAAEGYPEDGYLTSPELVGITELEKLVGGKKAFESLLGDIVRKPEGKPTLVPASDKRAEWQGASSADADFED